MKVTDKAQVIASTAKLNIIGIRPGEKLHEQMIGAEDSQNTYDYPEHFKILPQIHEWATDTNRVKDGLKVPDGLVYSSDSNPDWMTDTDLQSWIDVDRHEFSHSQQMTPHGKQYITQDSSYPAPIEQANLRQIPELAKRFNVLTGLSDHTLGTTASVAAIAVGACWIEKQFTLSRSDAGPDSAFSLEPDELHRLCEKHETPSSLWERPASICKKLKRVVRSFVNHYIS